MTNIDPPACTDDVQWPPDAGWSSNLSAYLCLRDHWFFTLVQGWVVNSTYSSTFQLTGTTEEPYSTIRTNTFTTNSLSSFTQQEIGVQSAGSYAVTAGTLTQGTYFDDFGFRLGWWFTRTTPDFRVPCSIEKFL